MSVPAVFIGVHMGIEWGREGVEEWGREGVEEWGREGVEERDLDWD